jgi:alpha-tubulin suppressor-like RCC1 family protein
MSLTPSIMRSILFYASDQDEPTYVDALRGVVVRQIACGSGHTVVLTIEGEVYTWGRGKVMPAFAFR